MRTQNTVSGTIPGKVSWECVKKELSKEVKQTMSCPHFPTVCVSALVSRFLIKFLPLLHSLMNYEVESEDIEYNISFPNMLLVMLFITEPESKL